MKSSANVWKGPDDRPDSNEWLMKESLIGQKLKKITTMKVITGQESGIQS